MISPECTQLIVLPDPIAVANEGVRRFISYGREEQEKKEYFMVGFSGGETPVKMYQLLRDEPYRSQLNWAAVLFFMADERHWPTNHRESNFNQLYTELIDFVPFHPGNVHRVRTDNGAERCADEYNHVLTQCFTQSGDKPLDESFDLLILGVGTDGHTASLFPGSELIHEQGRLYDKHIIPTLSPDVRWRVTVTPLAIQLSNRILVLVTGERKQEIMQELFEGDQPVEEVPAKLIAPRAGRALWIVDAAAAGELSDSTIRRFA